jgi:hypothetical protein
LCHVPSRDRFITRIDPQETPRRAALQGDLGTLRVIIQHAANAHPTDGPATLATAGMNEKDNRGPGRADFAVRQKRVSGMVLLIARSKGLGDWSRVISILVS